MRRALSTWLVFALVGALGALGLPPSPARVVCTFIAVVSAACAVIVAVGWARGATDED